MMDTNNNNTNTNTNTNNNEEEPWYHEGEEEGEHQKDDDDKGVASSSSLSIHSYMEEEEKKKEDDTNEEDRNNELSVAVVDFASPHAPKLLTDSLKTTGFAVVTNTPVSNDLIHEVYHEWRQFMIRLHHDYQKSNRNHQSSNDTAATNTYNNNNINNKTTMNLADKYYFNMLTQDGYFPTAVSETAKGATARDLKHYYQLYFPHGKYPDHTDVSEKARVLWTELVHLGKTIVGWIDEYLPPEIRATIEEKIGKGTTLSECVSDHQTMMRILHYPGSGGKKSPPKKEDGAVRAAAHEDINLITVLPAGSSRGLQVQSQKTGKWLEVPLVKGSIVINVGDMLQEMSNHAYLSTTHRVIEMKDDDETNNNNNNNDDNNVDRTVDDNNNDCTVDDNNNDTTTHTSTTTITTTTTNNGDFGTNDRMSTPCFIHLKAKCPLSENYGSAEHYLKERLVTLGVIPPQVLEELLEQYPGGIIPGWDPQASE